MNDFQRVESLFELGLDLDPAARDVLLAEQCGDRPDLADKVRNMWKYDEEPDHDFEHMPQPDQLLIPETIGPYKVLGLLGHGGMGAVYKARQEQPNRLVALKVMHVGMTSPEYLHRFMAEQKALALMAHPNIAVVYDAGFTVDKSPYFAMEFLDGKPITQWCDDERLSIRQRMALLLQVCDGVSHAHQKGVVHRDLHPDNLIVIDQDGAPMPKIIDFGIAKLERPEQEEGYRTRVGAVMGTPEFMSPEQAAGRSAESGDTRSDVYALGSVLYKLLVGVTPLGDALKDKTFTQIVRIIQEGTITRPSGRIGEGGETVALQRDCDVRTLRQTVAGDLDWIVMKALDRDPERRYASVADLSRDLKHYLNDFPVSTRPPGRLYLMQKLISRNRYAVAAAGVILFLLVAGLTTTSIALVRSMKSEMEANQSLKRLEKVNDFYLDIFRTADPFLGGQEVTGAGLLIEASNRVADKYFDDLQLEIDTRMVLGESFMKMGVAFAVKAEFGAAYRLSREYNGVSDRKTLEAQLLLAHAIGFYDGDHEQTRRIYEEAYHHGLKRYPEDDPIILKLMAHLAESLMILDEIEQAERLISRVYEVQSGELASGSADLRFTRTIYGRTLLKKGDLAGAEAMFREIYDNLTAKRYPDERLLNVAMAELAEVLRQEGKTEEATGLYETLLSNRPQYMDGGHSNNLAIAVNYAIALRGLGQNQEALDLLLASTQHLCKSIPSTQVTIMRSREMMGDLYMKLGDYEQALAVIEATLAMKQEAFGECNSRTLTSRWNYGRVLAMSGRKEQANDMFVCALEDAKKHLGARAALVQKLDHLYAAFQEGRFEPLM